MCQESNLLWERERVSINLDKITISMTDYNETSFTKISIKSMFDTIMILGNEQKKKCC